MPLDATVGGATANSYLTLATANALLEGHLHTDVWFVHEATMLQREEALMWATSLLERLVQWSGTPATDTQALAWPQTGQTDRFGRPVATTVIPQDVQQATAWYALALLQEQYALAQGTPPTSVKSRRMGDITITYQDLPAQSAQSQARSPQVAVPREVRMLLAPYGMVVGGITVPLLRT